MSQFLGGIFMLGVLGLCLAAFFPVLNTLFPKRIARTRRMIETLPTRSFWIGVVNIVLALVVLAGRAALGNALHGAGGKIILLILLLILVPLAIALVIGLAGVVRAVGERLLPEKSLLAQTIWATVALALACALPFVGWFLLLPYLGSLGMGAFMLGLFSKQAIEPIIEESSSDTTAG